MILNIFPTSNIPTVTAQEKGEAIRYKFQSGKMVPFVSHYEKPAVVAARNWFSVNILRTLKHNKLPIPKYEGAVRLSIDLFYQTNVKKKFGKEKETKPDLDNTVKLIQDVMADLGFFTVGDQQVVDLHVRKFWDEVPHLIISIEEVNG